MLLKSKRSIFGKRLLLALLLMFIITQLFTWIDDIFLSTNNEFKHTNQNKKRMFKELEELLRGLVSQDKGTGCKMAQIDPFSADTSIFDTDVRPINCSVDDWVECNFTECYVKQPFLDRMKDLICIYEDIIYFNDDTYYFGDSVKVNDDNKYTLNISDYVKVSCSGIEINNSLRWWRVGWRGYKAGYRPLPKVASQTPALNVFVFIVDSVSRNTFIRRMPVSYKVLKDELQAVVMNGYNIVGQATEGALWPILTGHSELEGSNSRRQPNNTERVDSKPFLFTFLKKYGYRTAYLEDAARIGTFNFRFNGFGQMPADHYMRHLAQSMELWDQKTWTNNDRFCFGSETLFKFMAEYSARLFKISGKKFCLTLSVTFSHDDINLVTLIDDDLADMLRKFKSDGHLKDTLLFVMADHGSRHDSIRNSYLGRFEEHLPFVSIVLPEQLKQARPDALHNLVANSKVLTTPFDVHTTILDALGLRKRRNKYKVPGADLERGMSFLEPIPESRSCSEAGVVPHLCTCAQWYIVSTDEFIYERAGQELARFINGVTAQERNRCVERDLLSIEWVYRLGPRAEFFGFTTKKTIIDGYYSGGYLRDDISPVKEYYKVKIIMGPAKAIYEASMQYIAKEYSFKVFDWDVARVNKYGDESKCVSRTEPHLNKYCYCKN